AVGRFNVAGLGRQVLFQKIGKLPFTNKTNACGIFFVVGNEPLLFSNPAHFRLFQFAHRKQGAGDALAGDGMQEVALVFVGIQPLEQLGLAAAIVERALAGVMAGRDVVGAQSNVVIHKFMEIYVLVSEDVRIGGPAGTVF